MTKCVLCGEDNHKKLFNVDKYEIHKCRVCGLVKTERERGVTYDHYHRDEDYQIYIKCFKNIYQKRFNIIKRFKSEPGRILDIGASAGTMLQLFQMNGWEVWGVEPSAVAGRAVSDIKMLNTTIEKAEFPKNHFDAVILNHTLEHLKNPVLVLKKVKTILKKGGVVYVDVPNFGSLDAQVWPSRWQYLLPDEHLYHFTPKTLRKTLEKAGFKVVWWRTWSGIFDVANPFLHIFQELIDLRLAFINDVLHIPTNIVTTTFNVGTGLGMVGEKK